MAVVVAALAALAGGLYMAYTRFDNRLEPGPGNVAEVKSPWIIEPPAPH